MSDKSIRVSAFAHEHSDLEKKLIKKFSGVPNRSAIRKLNVLLNQVFGSVLC